MRTLLRAIRFLIVVLTLMQSLTHPPPAKAQSPVAATPAFEVASVKASKPDRNRSHYLYCAGGRFVSFGMPLMAIITWAYDFPQVSGGPNWLSSLENLYDIEAKAEGPVTESQCRMMVRTLLASRFQLEVHRAKEELPVYALATDHDVSKTHAMIADDGLFHEGRVVRINGTPLPAWWPPGRQPSAEGLSMAQLCIVVSRAPELEGRPVIDRTELSGTYTFSLEFSMGEGNERPDIFTALQKQLGLRLRATREILEILVIDGAEKIPTGN